MTFADTNDLLESQSHSHRFEIICSVWFRYTTM